MTTSFTGCQTFGRTFINEKTQQQGTRVYNVWASERIPLEEALSAPFLPEIGDEWDPGSGPQGFVAIRQTPMEVDKEQQYYKVQIDYQTDDSYSDNWDIKMATVKKTYVPWRTKSPYSNKPPEIFDDPKYLGPAGFGGDESESNYPVVNRANDYFDPPLKEQRYLTKITLKRTVDLISDIGTGIANIEDLMRWRGKMNDDGISIASIGGVAWTFKVDDIQTNRLPQSDGSYDTEVTIIILYDPQTHCQVPYNVGYNQIVEKDGQKQKQATRDKSGNKDSTPAILDPEGKKVNNFELPAGATGATGPPWLIVFHSSRTSDFRSYRITGDCRAAGCHRDEP